jgi:hypothetical protein
MLVEQLISALGGITESYPGYATGWRSAAFSGVATQLATGITRHLLRGTVVRGMERLGQAAAGHLSRRCLSKLATTHPKNLSATWNFGLRTQDDLALFFPLLVRLL